MERSPSRLENTLKVSKMKDKTEAGKKSAADRESHVLVVRIVGFVVVLILLLSILAGYTLSHLGSIDDETEEFSVIEIPLRKVVKGVQEHQLEQHLILERIFRISFQETDENERDTKIDEEIACFNDHGLQIDVKIETGIGLAVKAQTMSDKIAEQYENVLRLLLDLQNAHQEFEVNVWELAALIKDSRSLEVLEHFEELEGEAEDLDFNAKLLYIEIGLFEDESVRGIEEHRSDTIQMTGLIVIIEAGVAVVLGAYMVLFTSDHVTKRKMMEDVLHKSEEKYRFLIDKQGEGIVIANADDQFTFCNPAAEKIFGVPPGQLVGRKLQEFVGPGLLEAIDEQNERLRAGEQNTYDLEIIRPDGEKRYIFNTVTPWFGTDGGYLASFGIFRDITERKKAEKRIKASLEEKEVLLKEIHHRVKNNLQIISSLLDLQSRSIRDDEVLAMFRESQNRIRSMAFVHERLYQSKDLGKIDFAEYIWDLVSYLFHSYSTGRGVITLDEDVDDLSLDIDKAIPCGLIINELVSNSLKHAFPEGRDGEIRVEFHAVDDDTLTLVVEDNGIGFPIGFPAGVDFKNTESLGLRLVGMLARQLEGTVELERDGGTTFRITFPRET